MGWAQLTTDFTHSVAHKASGKEVMVPMYHLHMAALFSRGRVSREHGSFSGIIILKIIHKAVPSWDDLLALSSHLGLIVAWKPRDSYKSALSDIPNWAGIWGWEEGFYLLHMPKGTPYPSSLCSPVLRDDFHLSIVENFPLAIFLAPTLYLTFKTISLSAINLDVFQRTYYVV